MTAQPKRAPRSDTVYRLFVDGGWTFSQIARWLRCSKLAAEDAYRRAHRRRVKAKRGRR